jgi:hypothetical protein
MEAACEVAKIEGCTMHILRHTYASHAIMDGMPIEVLSKQLVHKDLRITMKHYAHLCKTFKQTLLMKHAPSFGFSQALSKTAVIRERNEDEKSNNAMTSERQCKVPSARTVVTTNCECQLFSQSRF